MTHKSRRAVHNIGGIGHNIKMALSNLLQWLKVAMIDLI